MRDALMYLYLSYSMSLSLIPFSAISHTRLYYPFCLKLKAVYVSDYRIFKRFSLYSPFSNRHINHFTPVNSFLHCSERVYLL